MYQTFKLTLPACFLPVDIGNEIISRLPGVPHGPVTLYPSTGLACLHNSSLA